MSKAPPTAPVKQPNPLAGWSLVIAIVGGGIVGSAKTEVELDTRGLIGGAVGIIALVLAIIAVRKAKVLRRGRGLAIAGIVVGCLVGINVLHQPLRAAREGAHRRAATGLVGRVAPSFSLSGTDGKAVTDASLKGSAYVLAFSPPPEALTTIDATCKKYKGDGVKVFAVFPAQYGGQVASFIKSNGLSIPVLTDTDDRACGAQYYAFGTPETVLVGRDGTIAKVLFGTDIQADLDQALAAAAPKK